MNWENAFPSKRRLNGRTNYLLLVRFLFLFSMVSELSSVFREKLMLTTSDARNHSASKKESHDVVELSRLHVEPPSHVSAAVCYKTLFGDIDIGIVLQWVAYNRLLGFDHVYMFYRPELRETPGFHTLRSLPYVTLTEYKGGTRQNYYNQWKTEQKCLNDQKYGAAHDWVYLADVDEYLWFPQNVGLKEFLTSHDDKNYLSFGKRMYTLDHRTDLEARNFQLKANGAGFVLSHYPFHMENFCYHNRRRRGEAICPTWRGRAKLLVRPSHYKRVDTHGTKYFLDASKGKIHFSPEEAVILEWPSIFSKHNVTKRAPVDFSVEEEGEVNIHNLVKGFARKNGKFPVHHDNQLLPWFDYVLSRFNDIS